MTRIIRLLIYIGLMFSLTLPAMAEETGPPNAVDDHIEIEQKTTHIYVLDNDSANGDPLDPATLSIVSAPSRGDAVVIAKGAVRVKYTVTATEPFTDKFRYSICNTAGLCATATVTVNYQPTPTTTTTSTTSTTTPATTTTADTAPQPTTPPTTGPSEQTEGQSDQADDTAAPQPTSTAEPVKPPPDPDNLPELTYETPSRPDAMNPPGTTIGEPNGFQFHADMLYLGRTGKDTLRMVATPALMVSGLVGFLMVGLPQNAFGTALGFLVTFRRKRRPEQDAETPSNPDDVL